MERKAWDKQTCQEGSAPMELKISYKDNQDPYQLCMGWPHQRAGNHRRLDLITDTCQSLNFCTRDSRIKDQNLDMVARDQACAKQLGHIPEKKRLNLNCLRTIWKDSMRQFKKVDHNLQNPKSDLSTLSQDLKSDQDLDLVLDQELEGAFYLVDRNNKKRWIFTKLLKN